MNFDFYPRRNDPCPNVGHCPHAGGAAIATLVQLSNDNGQFQDYLHGTIDAERKRNIRLFQENEKLKAELEQVKLELKLERQNKFATNKQKQAEAETSISPPAKPPTNKRGAPVGHPGWFRPTATEYDCKAIYLRNVIGISYRKVPRVIDELFKVTFTPAALLGFEEKMAEKSKPVVDDIAKKLGSSDGAVHADETYWTLDGDRAYFWVHADEAYVHFQFDTTRAGKVSRDVLGPHFTGTLVTDCYSGYAAHTTDKKQKCLAHLARTARDWQKLTKEGTFDFAFFKDVREFVKRACAFHRQRAAGSLNTDEQRAAEYRLRERLQYLSTMKVSHEKAVTLQGRINRHFTEWLIFVDDRRVPPTNNLAERALRPLVVLRKITFGHRSEAGANRMAKLMSVAETARRQGHRASDIYFELLTRPPDAVLKRLYAKPHA